jgi:hypothetical protein
MVVVIAGLLRCGKSCRLRWTNYLRPDLKRGLLSEYEEKMVIDLHAQLGNRLSITLSLSVFSNSSVTIPLSVSMIWSPAQAKFDHSSALGFFNYFFLVKFCLITILSMKALDQLQAQKIFPLFTSNNNIPISQD